MRSHDSLVVKVSDRGWRVRSSRRVPLTEYHPPYEVKRASWTELNDMAKNGIQKYFDVLYKQWQKYAVAQESYFEGGCVLTI
ncbi:hypothetical protein TNCV_1940001 [Trichonephila clavipes]|nr:hypothetical protein TNCV_1940001 [Trichonephila clavipes]